jgi:hypothetical protein
VRAARYSSSFATSQGSVFESGGRIRVYFQKSRITEVRSQETGDTTGRNTEVRRRNRGRQKSEVRREKFKGERNLMPQYLQFYF